jgi:shikimate kinase
MRIYLIGFMGCGKSHIGKELALLMKYKFIDIDEYISLANKKSVNEIFEKKGEDFFRKEEKKAIRKISEMKNMVVAAGGGLPCFNDNMNWMNENGITVYLEASPQFLYHRLFTEKKTRPLISNIGDIELVDFITGKLLERKEFYEQAQIIVSAEKMNIKKLKEKILKLKKSA